MPVFATTSRSLALDELTVGLLILSTILLARRYYIIGASSSSSWMRTGPGRFQTTRQVHVRDFSPQKRLKTCCFSRYGFLFTTTHGMTGYMWAALHHHLDATGAAPSPSALTPCAGDIDTCLQARDGSQVVPVQYGRRGQSEHLETDPCASV